MSISITQLPFPRHIGLKHVKEFTLHEDLCVGQWTVPKGATVKIYQSQNFGICVLVPGQQDKRGFEIPQRIFRY